MDPTNDIKSVANLRDVGKTVNVFLGDRRIKEGMLYRSARPDDASVEDANRLRDDLGIRTVLDLRTKTELLKQAQKRQGTPRKVPEADPAHQIPGLRYLHVSISGRAFELYLLRQLSWWCFLCVRLLCAVSRGQAIFYYLLGYRIQVMALMAREVLVPRGLVGMGLDMMDQSHQDIFTALNSFLEPSGLPTLVHCTQGKDRTGLIVALVLIILRVPQAAIEHDYSLTDQALIEGKEQRLAEMREVKLPDSWHDTAPGMIAAIVGHLTNAYGGSDEYLDVIGFTNERRTQLRERLLY